MERRDYQSRAARVQTLLELLNSHVDGLDLAELPPAFPGTVAARILKPLAIRGLVKVTQDRWIPSPALLVGVRLPLREE